MDAFINFFQGLYRESIRYRNANGNVLCHPVHRIDIAEVDHHTFVAQMLQRHVTQIKVYPLHKHVGRDGLVMIAHI